MPPEIAVIGEGETDVIVARRLVQVAGGADGRSLLGPTRGKQRLLARLPGLMKGASFGHPLLVLIDLDQSGPCAGAFLVGSGIASTPSCLLRVAVRSVESWLMADRDAYARYAGAPVREIPTSPDVLVQPKRKIQELADTGSARRLISTLAEARGRGVPDWRTLGRWHSDFAQSFWQPDRARLRSPSLDRCLTRLSEFVSALA